MARWLGLGQLGVSWLAQKQMTEKLDRIAMQRLRVNDVNAITTLALSFYAAPLLALWAIATLIYRLVKNDIRAGLLPVAISGLSALIVSFLISLQYYDESTLRKGLIAAGCFYWFVALAQVLAPLIRRTSPWIIFTSTGFLARLLLAGSWSGTVIASSESQPLGVSLRSVIAILLLELVTLVPAFAAFRKMRNEHEQMKEEQRQFREEQEYMRREHQRKLSTREADLAGAFSKGEGKVGLVLARERTAHEAEISDLRTKIRRIEEESERSLDTQAQTFLRSRREQERVQESERRERENNWESVQRDLEEVWEAKTKGLEWIISVADMQILLLQQPVSEQAARPRRLLRYFGNVLIHQPDQVFSTVDLARSLDFRLPEVWHYLKQLEARAFLHRAGGNENGGEIWSFTPAEKNRLYNELASDDAHQTVSNNFNWTRQMNHYGDTNNVTAQAVGAVGSHAAGSVEQNISNDQLDLQQVIELVAAIRDDPRLNEQAQTVLSSAVTDMEEGRKNPQRARTGAQRAFDVIAGTGIVSDSVTRAMHALQAIFQTIS